MKRFWKSTDTPHFENSHAPPPFPRVCARIVRTAAFNALLIVAGVTLIAAAGEAYFRVSVPYGFAANPQDFVGRNAWHFVPNVGVTLTPNSEVRSSNHLDFWVITRTNRLGFLDREPINPKRAAESCHIALIGDSFVVGKEVDIADKTQVKLEEIAARELPHLDITTSAFGYGGFGQINQIPFYDEYARHLRPKVVALVFVNNDFRENSNVLAALRGRLDPERLPVVTAARGADGTVALRPPDPNYTAFSLPSPPPGQSPSFVESFLKRAGDPAKHEGTMYYHFAKWEWEAVKRLYFARWLDAKIKMMFIEETRDERLIWHAELISRRPRYSTLLQEWTPTTYANMSAPFGKAQLPPVFEEALAYTKFGLEQFKQRAERDGANLVILATHSMRAFGDLPFERMSAMAAQLDIPIIDQRDYIVRIGADPEDSQWNHDAHWNKNGHRWAAEALLEWIRDNQDVCSERG